MMTVFVYDLACKSGWKFLRLNSNSRIKTTRHRSEHPVRDGQVHEIFDRYYTVLHISDVPNAGLQCKQTCTINQPKTAISSPLINNAFFFALCGIANVCFSYICIPVQAF